MSPSLVLGALALFFISPLGAILYAIIITNIDAQYAAVVFVVILIGTLNYRLSGGRF